MTKILISIFLITFQFLGYAQVSFQRMYRNIKEFNIGGSFGATILQTTDSGYVILGINSDTLNAGLNDIYLIKTNSFGDTLWTKIYGTSQLDYAYKIIQTSDGGFAFCGVSESNTILIKTNDVGDTLWTKKYLSSNYFSMAHSLKQTSDGGFILAGEVCTISPNTDFLLMKTDIAGNLQWAKKYGGIGLERAFSVFEINGSGYILSGFSQSFSPMNDEFYVVRTDLNGNLLWSKIYGGNGTDIPYCMHNTNDGGFIMAGISSSFNGNNQDIYIMKIDSIGNLIWSKDYDISLYDYANFLSQTNNNGFVVSGGINIGGVNFSPFILKLNSSGNTIWSKTIDTNYIAYCGIQTNDNGYAFLTKRCDPISCGLSLHKTDSLGNACIQNSISPNNISHTTFESVPATISDTSSFFDTSSLNLSIGSRGYISQICSPLSAIQSMNNKYELNIFPNPYSSQTNIQTNISFHNATLTFFNIFGQSVKQINNISGQTITLDRDYLSNGLYVVQLTEDNIMKALFKIVITD